MPDNEKNPIVGWLAYIADPKRPGKSSMQDGQIEPISGRFPSYIGNSCYRDKVVFVDDTPYDANWPNVEITIDGEAGLGWHGHYRAFSSIKAAREWIKSGGQE